MKLCRRSGIGKFSAHVSYCCNFCFTQNKVKEGRGKERRESGKDGLGGGVCREAEAAWGGQGGGGQSPPLPSIYCRLRC